MPSTTAANRFQLTLFNQTANPGKRDLEVICSFFQGECFCQFLIRGGTRLSRLGKAEPLMLRIIVQLAVAQDVLQVAPGKGGDDHVGWIGMLHGHLSVWKMVKRNAGIDVVSRVIHNVMEDRADGPREFHVNRAADLAIEEAPFFGVVEPSDAGMGMVEENDQAHKLVPEKLGKDDGQSNSEPNGGLEIGCCIDRNGDLNYDKRGDGEAINCEQRGGHAFAICSPREDHVLEPDLVEVVESDTG